MSKGLRKGQGKRKLSDKEKKRLVWFCIIILLLLFRLLYINNSQTQLDRETNTSDIEHTEINTNSDVEEFNYNIFKRNDNKKTHRKKSKVIYSGVNYLKNAFTTKGEVVIWDKDPIYYYIEPNGYAHIVREAFDEYQKEFGDLITLRERPYEKTSDINVLFKHKLENTNTEHGYVAGFTNAYHEEGTTNLSKAIVNLITENPNTGEALTDAQMYHLALHEIGHALGVSGHSSEAGDVMHTNANNLRSKLSERDKNTIKIMYSNNEELIREAQNEFRRTKLTEALSYSKELPNKTTSWINLGNAYFSLDMTEEALTSYKKALELDPTDYNIYISMAQCYMEVKNYDEAIVYYEEAKKRTQNIEEVKILEETIGFAKQQQKRATKQSTFKFKL